MFGTRYRCEGCGGIEEVYHITQERINQSRLTDHRAHPYEEPAYEVYKMEDL